MKSFASPDQTPPFAPLRSSARLARRFVCAVVPLLASLAFGQTITSAVPNYVSYQGKVTNAAGTAVGAGTPVNRTVIFRVWSHASNSTVNDLVYSEQQTVTISEGEFSVLIGQGTAVSGTPLGYSESAKGPPSNFLANAFGGATRYLGVTIDDGTAAADPEISPRQQLVTVGYAFRARFAEGLGSNGNFSVAVTDQGNFGVGIANPVFPVTTAATLGDKLGLFGNFNYGLGIQLSTVQLHGASATDDIVFGYGTSAALTETMRVKGNGSVGIGTNTPTAKLDVNGAINLLDGGVKNNYGGLVSEAGAQMVNFGINDARFGTQANSLQGGFLRVNTQSGSNLFQVFARAAASASPGEVFSITSGGNVGIGNTSPSAKLHVNGSISGGAISASSIDVNGVVGILDGGSKSRPAGISSEVGGAIANFGANDSRFGTAVSTDQGGFLRVDSRSGSNLFGFYARPASGSLSEILSLTSAGNASLTGNATIKGNSAVLGYLSLGTSTPAYATSKLSILTTDNSTSSANFRFNSTAGTESWIHYGTNGDIYWRSGATTGKVILQDTGGFVGIGTSSPSVPLHVAGGTSINFNVEAWGTTLGFADSGNVNMTKPLGGIFDSGLRCAEFYINSDARIKMVKGRSDGVADLATLQKIQVTDFAYRDRLTYGVQPQKKVIAQQVEEVFPQAVSRSVGVVPDIFEKAGVADGWVSLATDLKVGERVRLIGDGKQEVHEVLAVEPGRFRTAFKPAGDRVFVYGREVQDFRSVDYEAIAMLNVSATQEIKREKDAEIAALQKRVAELEAKDRARDAKLAAIEKLLSAGQTVMARPSNPAKNEAGGQE